MKNSTPFTAQRVLTLPRSTRPLSVEEAGLSTCSRSVYTSVISALVLLATSFASAQDPAFTREMDIIYHKQDGFALTMDKIVPKENVNHAAVIIVVSGGWFSNHDELKPHQSDQLPTVYTTLREQVRELLGRGYTLFYVVHGSQPKFTIREIHEQISAAVRHIRHHARDYGIAPNRVGIIGYSAGGHLALMQGTKGKDGEESPKDPSQASSRVQATVDYWGPTDFVNYGADGVFFDDVVREVLDGRNIFLQAFDYYESDDVNKRLIKVTDPERLAQHYRDISPYYHVTADDAPTLILHGEADKLVPLQQAQRISAKFQEAGVPTKLHVKERAGHAWEASEEEIRLVADWFDTYLLK